MPVNPDVPENDDHTPRHLAQHLAARLTLTQKRLPLPFITQEVSRNRHLGKHNHLNPYPTRLCNQLQHAAGILPWPSGKYFDLSQSQANASGFGNRFHGLKHYSLS
jgi:hypothetical protein